MSIVSILNFPFFRTRDDKIQKSAEICGIDFRRAVAAFEDAGFWVVREGVHIVMTDGQHILTIPCHDPVNPVTMEGIVRDAGLTPGRFRQLL
jgi:hypothetical protein